MFGGDGSISVLPVDFTVLSELILRGLRGERAAITLKPSEETWHLVEMLELGTV